MAEDTLRCQVGRVVFGISRADAERASLIERAAERLNVLLREKRGDADTPLFSSDEQVITYIALELMSHQLWQEERELQEDVVGRLELLNGRIKEALDD
jgi:hypothetical protein